MKMTGMFVGNNPGKLSPFHGPLCVIGMCHRGAGESEKLKIRCGRAYN